MNDSAADFPALAPQLTRTLRSCRVVLPFALPPSELARDLFAPLALPAAQTLLSLGQPQTLPPSAAYARSLPHEALLLAALFGPDCQRLPLASLLPAWPHLPQDASQHWLLLTPVYLHIARDHLVLTDQRQLPLPQTQARALFDSAQAIFAEEGMALHYADSHSWLLQADVWRDFDCASLDAACGHNIEIWLPKHAATQEQRRWRRLLNEIQMAWHAHPVNEERLQANWPPVNALWLSGGPAHALRSDAPQLLAQAACPRVQALARLSNAEKSDLLLWNERLSAPALASDWGSWQQCWEQLEAELFAPLLQALQQGRLQKLELILSDSQQAVCFHLTRRSLWRFWRRAGWDQLLATVRRSSQDKGRA